MRSGRALLGRLETNRPWGVCRLLMALFGVVGRGGLSTFL